MKHRHSLPLRTLPNRHARVPATYGTNPAIRAISEQKSTLIPKSPYIHEIISIYIVQEWGMIWQSASNVSQTLVLVLCPMFEQEQKHPFIGLQNSYFRKHRQLRHLLSVNWLKERILIFLKQHFIVQVFICRAERSLKVYNLNH